MFTQGFTVHYSPLDFLATKTQGVIKAIRNKDDRVKKTARNRDL